MAYQVKYTETTNPAKPSITVEDQTLNTETGLTFVGKNYAGYAPIVAENFLHLLENFASSVQPTNPVQGQLWYDNSAGVNLLKVYDGTAWTAAGSVKKSPSTPQNNLKGDLWVDTTNQQLYIYSGSNWLLVGPQYSSGAKTGPVVDTIVDINNTSHNVVSLYAQDNLMAVVSKDTFTPKQAIPGFATINQGMTLTSTDVNSTSAPTRFHGVAVSADNLLINNSPIEASNFLRSDVVSTTTQAFNVRSNNGISVGSDLNFNISTESNAVIMYSRTSGNSLQIKLNNNNTPTTVIHVDANAKVGIGANNSNPAETLDVAGSVSVDGGIIVLGDVDSDLLGRGSIRTNGGLSVNKNANIGGTLTLQDKLIVNNLDSNDAPIAGPIFYAGSTNAAGLYDLGTNTIPFRNLYAESIGKNDGSTVFNGRFAGSVTGSVSGSAASLASPTPFKLEGEVISNTIDFDGQNQTATFTTSITTDIITTRVVANSAGLTDQMLIYKSGVSGGLRSITKSNFLSDIATVPVGVIFPYTSSTLPPGYLFCDGSEVKIGEYPLLWAVLGYTYRPQNLLLGSGTFALPDLRGRFPLGRDNMDNTNEVLDNTNSPIPGGGGPADRVTSSLADQLGAGSGSESVTLDVSNLPQHLHDMRTDSAQYYASGEPGAANDPDAFANKGMPNTSIGFGIKNSGGILTDGRLGQPLIAMNPYLTINYIIFTGKIL
jgi:microcystin-dependent protein